MESQDFLKHFLKNVQIPQSAMGRACVSWVGNKGLCASPKGGRQTFGRRKINGTVDTGARCVLTQAFRPLDNAWMLCNKGGNTSGTKKHTTKHGFFRQKNETSNTRKQKKVKRTHQDDSPHHRGNRGPFLTSL